MSPLGRFIPHPCSTATVILSVALCLGFVVLLSPIFVAKTQNTAPQRGQQKVLPLDPLTPEETEVAARIASADRRVREALGGGRQRLIQVQFLALKPPDYRETREPEQLKIGRHAAVLFYRYDTDQGLYVVVDLEQRAVGELTRLEGNAVPLASEEVAEAFNLALRNERVKALLGSRAGEFKVARLATGERPEARVEGLRVIATSPRDPCYRHRCLELLFRLPEGYIAGTSVNVDLTAQTVRVERTAR